MLPDMLLLLPGPEPVPFSLFRPGKNGFFMHFARSGNWKIYQFHFLFLLIYLLSLSLVNTSILSRTFGDG